MRKTNVADAGALKVVDGAIQRRSQLILSTLLDHAKEQPKTFEARMEEVATIKDVLKNVEVQVVEAIARLKTVEDDFEAEASSVPKEVV